MSAHSHDNMAPPAAIRAAVVLAGLALLLVVTVRTGLVPVAPSAAEARAEAQVAPVAERQLSFSDQADGRVAVVNAETGANIAMLGSEGSGFIRGVLRGFARERRQHGLGADAPFRLALWPDGALSLTDHATGRTVELNGFGPDNRAAFHRLLDLQDGGVAL